MELEVQSTEPVEATATATPDATPSDTSAPSAPDTGTGSEQPQGSPTPIPATSEAQTEAQPPAAQPAAQKPVDWAQRYSHLQSETDRRLNAMRREQQTHQQELANLRQFRQQQEARAQQLQLKPWSKQHPDYQKFQGVLGRAKTVDQQLNAIPEDLPPEQKQVLKDAILSAVSPEDRQQLQSYKEEVQNFQRQFFEDPIGALESKLAPLIEDKIRQATERQMADHRVEQDFQSPELQPLVEKHAGQLQEALAAGVPYEHAMHTLRLFSELEQTRAQLDALTKNAAMGSEQIRLAKGKATITRDPVSSSTEQDQYALAKKEAAKRGIATSDPRFMKILAQFDRSKQSVFTQHPAQ